MRNWKRILTGGIAAALTLCATLALADEQLITLNYRGTDVRKAITLLQSVSDLRVVIAPQVGPKKVTLALKDLSPEDALRTVASAAGLNCRKVGNAFLIEPKPVDRKEKADAVIAPDAARFSPPAGPDGASAGLGGGIIQPDQPGRGSAALRITPPPAAEVPATVLEALDRPVDVDVKNGPLTSVMEQLSKSSGIRVEADTGLADGLVATVGLHGIPLKNALELVAGQTGLQITPQPNGVLFKQPGLSLEALEARQRAPAAGSKHVEQGQLWSAEWAKALTIGISTSASPPAGGKLRRQPLTPATRADEIKLRRAAPPAAPAPASSPAAAPHNDGRSSDRSKATPRTTPPTPVARRTGPRLKPRKAKVTAKGQASTMPVR